MAAILFCGTFLQCPSVRLPVALSLHMLHMLISLLCTSCLHSNLRSLRPKRRQHFTKYHILKAVFKIWFVLLFLCVSGMHMSQFNQIFRGYYFESFMRVHIRDHGRSFARPRCYCAVELVPPWRKIMRSLNWVVYVCVFACLHKLLRSLAYYRELHAMNKNTSVQSFKKTLRWYGVKWVVLPRST